MQNHDETRRYLTKVSRVGIIAATVFSFLYGLTVFFTFRGLYENKPIFYMFKRITTLHPMLIAFTVGLLALAVCGALSLVWRSKPALAEKAWILAGKVTLLAVPVGYIQGMNGLSAAALAETTIVAEYLFAFSALIAVFLGFALGRRGISLNQSFLNAPTRTYILRVLKNTAILLGVMLVAVLLLMVQGWLPYRELRQDLSAGAQFSLFVVVPLRLSAPVAAPVVLGYPLLSLVARLDEVPKKRLMGKGSVTLLWVSLGMNVALWGIRMAWNGVALDYGTDRYGLLTELGVWQLWMAPAVAFASVWALCRVVAYARTSKIVLWGAGGLLGVVILRELFLGWGIRIIKLIIQVKKQHDAGVGIIGGADVSVTTTVQMAKLETWSSMLFTALSVIALCVLAVGLTRHCRVSKAFWAVPVLTAATVAIMLLVDLLWVKFLDGTSLWKNEGLRWTLAVLLPSLPALIRSLVGVVALTRAPAEKVLPSPATLDGEEPPKPRVEDYLYQL